MEYSLIFFYIPVSSPIFICISNNNLKKKNNIRLKDSHPFNLNLWSHTNIFRWNNSVFWFLFITFAYLWISDPSRKKNHKQIVRIFIREVKKILYWSEMIFSNRLTRNLLFSKVQIFTMIYFPVRLHNVKIVSVATHISSNFLERQIYEN